MNQPSRKMGVQEALTKGIIHRVGRLWGENGFGMFSSAMLQLCSDTSLFFGFPSNMNGTRHIILSPSRL